MHALFEFPSTACVAYATHPTARFTYRNKVLANSPGGCVEFIQWMRKHVTTELDKVHVIMEPTGVHHELLVYFLHDQGIHVSIVNPAYISDYAKSLSSLHKTDKGDSQVIARFGYERKPKAWQPEAKSVRELKAKLGRLDALQQAVACTSVQIHR